MPLADGRISDDSRIRASLPTLERLIAAKARIVLASHLGRPKGEPVPALSLAPVAEALIVPPHMTIRLDEETAGDASGLAGVQDLAP